MDQVEYCRNIIFKRSWPIRSTFRRSCELGLYLLTADRITVLFGGRRPRRLQGKLQSVMERMNHGRHVFRTYWRNSFLKQYEKAATFLRLELVCNRVKDFKLKKSLKHWEAMRQTFQQVTDRFAGVQAEHLNVHGQLDVVARLAQPVIQGQTKVAGIKLAQDDPRKRNPYDAYKITTDTFAPALAGRLPMGLTLGLSAGSDFSRTFTELLPLGLRETNDYAATVSLTLRQPLLKNFWIDAERQTILVNKKNLKISEESLRQQLINLVTKVQVA